MTHSLSRVFSALALVVALTLASSASHAQQPAQDESLYQALGERAGIQKIIEGMLLHIARDERIVGYFRNVDIVRVRDKLVELYCAETGGPCRYTGDSMAETHKGEHLTRGDLDALVEDLVESMNELKIAPSTQNRLLARLAPLGEQVIEK